MMVGGRVGEVVVETVKATPPTVVVGLNVLGYSISEWVQLATLLYIFLQMHVLAAKNIDWYKYLCKFIKEAICGRNKQE